MGGTLNNEKKHQQKTIRIYWLKKSIINMKITGQDN